jgi:hypothetical protein
VNEYFLGPKVLLGTETLRERLEFWLQPAQFENNHTIATVELVDRSPRMKLCERPPTAQAKA